MAISSTPAAGYHTQLTLPFGEPDSMLPIPGSTSDLNPDRRALPQKSGPIAAGSVLRPLRKDTKNRVPLAENPQRTPATRQNFGSPSHPKGVRHPICPLTVQSRGSFDPMPKGIPPAE